MPSTSLSFVKTTIAAVAVSSVVLAVSFAAIGESLNALTVTVTVAVFEDKPKLSTTVYVKLSSPLKFTAGV